MKNTLLYGAIGGVALYIYLQLQRKKQTVTTETKPSSTNKTTMPTKGVSVKNDAPTPPAPTVEPVYGGIKPSKPVKPTKPVKLKPPVLTIKPPVIIKPIDRGIYKPKDKYVKEVYEDTLGRPIDSSGRPIGMPIPKQDVILNGTNINSLEYHHKPSFNPYGHKAYMDKYLVTPERQIISR